MLTLLMFPKKSFNRLARHALLTVMIAFLLSYAVVTYQLTQALNKHGLAFSAMFSREYEHVEMYIDALAKTIKESEKIGNVEHITSLLKQFHVVGSDINSSDNLHISGMWWYWPERAYLISQFGVVQGEKPSIELLEKIAKTEDLISTPSFEGYPGVVTNLKLSQSVFKANRLIGSIHVVLDLEPIFDNLTKNSLEDFEVRLVEEEPSVSKTAGFSQKLTFLPYILNVSYQKPTLQLLVDHQFPYYVLGFCILVFLIFVIMEWYFWDTLRQSSKELSHAEDSLHSLRREQMTLVKDFQNIENSKSIQNQALKDRIAILGDYISTGNLCAQELLAAIDSYIAAIHIEYAGETMPPLHTDLLEHIKKKATQLATFTIAYTDTPIETESINKKVLNLFADQINLYKITVTESYAQGLPQFYIKAFDYKRLIIGIMQRALADVVKEGGIEIRLQAAEYKKRPGVACMISTQGLGLDDAMLARVLETSPHGGLLSNILVPDIASVQKTIARVGGHLDHSHTRSKGSIYKLWMPAILETKKTLPKKAQGPKAKGANNVVSLFS